MKYEIHMRTRSGSHYVWSPMRSTLEKVVADGTRTIEVSRAETRTPVGAKFHFAGARFHPGRRTYVPFELTTSDVTSEWHEPEPALVRLEATMA